MHFDAVPAAVGWKTAGSPTDDPRGERPATPNMDWAGRIVVDATNAIDFPAFTARNLQGRLSTEVIADLVPGARVVKAFNTLQAGVLAATPATPAGRRVLFVSGDHPEANQTVAHLIDTLGFYPIDLGPLSTGAPLQQFAGPLAKMNLLKV
jgi:predicted dinucleotide-binding enzyme